MTKYKKCFHGIYDAQFCAYCKGMQVQESNPPKNATSVKDVTWHGVGIAQPESDTPWNVPPGLQTSEEIWANTDSLLSDKVYGEFRIERYRDIAQAWALGLRDDYLEYNVPPVQMAAVAVKAVSRAS